MTYFLYFTAIYVLWSCWFFLGKKLHCIFGDMRQAFGWVFLKAEIDRLLLVDFNAKNFKIACNNLVRLGNM